MNVVGRVGTLISQGVYSVVTPLHPFGGAVDIIAVEQQDGTFRSTPWYVRFGKFQGVLKGTEKIVRISVNGVEANFHMYLDNSGEAYFTREVESRNDEGTNQDLKCADTSAKAENEDVMIENSTENDAFDTQDVDTSSMYHALSVSQNSSSEFHDNESQPSPSGSPHYGTYRYESLGHVEDLVNSQGTDSEVVLVSGDGHVLLAPISSADDNTDNLQLNTPHFELYPGEGEEEDIEQLENSSKFGRNGVHMKMDGQVQDAGVHSDDVGPSSSIVERDDSVSVSNISYSSGKVKPFSQGKDGDDSSVHSSVDDVEPSMNRLEVFKSCLEFSELTSELEADNMQKDDMSSVGLEPEGRIHDEQGQFESSFMTRDKVQEGRPLEVETSLCASISCTSNYAIEQTRDLNSEENALVDRETITAELQNMSIINGHDQLDQVDESLQPSVGCQEPDHIAAHERDDPQIGASQMSGLGFEISLCGNILRAGMGIDYANQAFNAHVITKEEFKASRTAIMKNENLIVRYRDRYFSWNKAAPIILGMAAFGLDLTPEVEDAIPVEQDNKEKLVEDNSGLSSTPSRRWTLWPNPFRRTQPLQHTSSNTSNDDDFVDSESFSPCLDMGPADASTKPPTKQIVRTNLPTSEQIASLNLRDGQNKIAFIFSTRVLGEQQVHAHIYLWKWNARIVISDVDGTITRSDVLGQFMPLLGKDWSQLGVARLFSAIKENGYQLLFLSARAIVQAYLTRNFLRNLKQDGEALPNGPVVISPDGLFPSLYREVILRRPHEFKIACLQDIRALFPSDYNPFYAGFGNRETDEISYRKIGIPKGKIFIINPKGEVAIHRCIDAKSYTSLHTLVNDMFPPTSLLEQEDFNSWNYWKVPIINID